MAMSDRAKKSNLWYLLVKGGTPVCRALFEKRVKDLKPKEEDSKTWTVNKFLQLKKAQLESKLGYEKTKVFPRDQQTVQVDTWDVHLLCAVLKESCEPNPALRLCLKELQEQRNNIAHLSDADIDDSTYEDSFGNLKWCIQTLLTETGDETLKHTIEDMIKRLETGNIPNEELKHVQQSLLTISKDITQEIRNQHDKTRKVIEKVADNSKHTIYMYLEMIYRKQEELDRTNQEILSYLRGQKHVQNPPQEIPIEIRYVNCSQEVDRSASEEFVRLFNKDVESNPHLSKCTENKEVMSKAVNDLTTELKDKGCTITKADVGCIVLHIQCSSILALLSLLRDYVNGSLDKSLTKLEQAARSLDGCENVRLEAVLYEDDYLKILSDIEFVQFVTTRQTTSIEQTKPKERQDNVHIPEDGKEASTLMKQRAVESTAVFSKQLEQDMSERSHIHSKREQLQVQEVPWWKQFLRSWIPTGSSDSARHNIKHQQKAVKETVQSNVKAEKEKLLEKSWRGFEKRGSWTEEIICLCENLQKSSDQLIQHKSHKWMKNLVSISCRRKCPILNHIEYVDLLKNDIKGIKHLNVSRSRILLFGPTSSGKSSFINSVATIDKGYISAMVCAGSSPRSITIKMNQYLPKHFATNFALIDTMGIAESDAMGIHVEDIKSLMEGKIEVSCTFNSVSPMSSETKTKPTLEEVGHCTVIMIDARVLDTGSFSYNLANKFNRLKEYAKQLNQRKVVVLTKIDLACGEIGENIENVYKSRQMYEIVKKAEEQFGVPEMNIFPVQNYSKEVDLDWKMDILILLALRQMVRFSHDRLENLHDQLNINNRATSLSSISVIEKSDN